MPTTILGIHHITAVSGRASENLAFYQNELGLRLVKKTVNFDDPNTYHLYYGDHEGAPGTLITFFPFDLGPNSSGSRGPGQMSETVYGLEPEAWHRFKENAAPSLGATEEQLLGRRRLSFRDPHGLALAVEEAEEADGGADKLGPFLGGTLWVQQPEPTRRVLELLGYRAAATEGSRQRFVLPHRPQAGYLDLLWTPADSRAFSGSGTVHHIALSVASSQEQQRWQQQLREAGIAVSPVRDRNYFESIYFREPGGILFEIATVPPGMAVDEPLEELGQTLRLPPQYEPHRARIESQLEPLTVKMP